MAQSVVVVLCYAHYLQAVDYLALNLAYGLRIHDKASIIPAYANHSWCSDETLPPNAEGESVNAVHMGFPLPGSALYGLMLSNPAGM